MPREYRHIKMYEKEIFELREQGLSQRQIAERLGVRYNKLRKLKNGQKERHSLQALVE